MAGVSRQAQMLAERLEQGASALMDFASRLSDADWQARIPKDGRKVGVVVHHVAKNFDGGNWLDAIRGSGDWVAGVDYILGLWSPGGKVKLRGAVSPLNMRA